MHPKKQLRLRIASLIFLLIGFSLFASFACRGPKSKYGGPPAGYNKSLPGLEKDLPALAKR